MEKKNIEISWPQLLVAGVVIIAVSIAGSYAVQKHYLEKNMTTLVKQAVKQLTPDPSNTDPVTKNDHILGSLSAPVKIVTYTDLECPYCKVFHQSIDALKDNYIKDGKVAFVYRNMPLDQLHTKARTEATAAECVAKLGGNDKYWSYVDKIFATTPSNDKLDLNLLPQFATDLGIDKTAFENCLKDKTIAAKIVAEEENGQNAGAQGTPYPVVIYNDEVKGALGGALSADQLKKLVDQLLSEKE